MMLKFLKLMTIPQLKNKKAQSKLNKKKKKKINKIF